MHELAFLQDLAVVMIVAGLVTLLFHRLRQPVVLGYILAGVIIGPHTPPFPLISDQATIRTLAELGIIFLMFSLGMEFNLRKLKQVGLPAFVAALLEIALMVGVGYELGRLFGWRSMDSLFLGAILAISSTTIIIKALGDMGRSKERFASLIFGILIIEDILAIVMIALLSGIAMTGSLGAADLGQTVGRLAIFLVTVLVIGLIAVPRLLAFVARFKSDEMLLVTTLGLCFGFSLLAVKLGYSVALGAFVIGAVVAESRELGRIERLTAPLRDMFSAVFFVAIGMLIEPAMLVAYAWPILAITLAVVMGKVVTCSFGTFVGGVDARTSLRVGMGLAQIGEFSFIIAALGLSLRVTSEFLYPIAVAVSALTTLLTPYLIRGTDTTVTWANRLAPQPLVSALKLYTQWISELRRASPRHPGLRILRSVVAQIVLNLALIAGVLIAAAMAVRFVPRILPIVANLPGGARTACWTAACALTLPIYVVTVRKMQALAMMVADISTSGAGGRNRSGLAQTIVTNVIFIAQLMGLVLFTLLLSAALLPPAPILAILLSIVALLTLFFGHSFSRWYGRAKGALIETWQQEPPPHTEAPPLPAALREARIETITLPPDWLNRLIRELALRTRTGASIVAVERPGGTVINPGPDEELLAGDQVLVLGTPAQIAQARQLLAPAGA